MSDESPKEFYNRQYTLHSEYGIKCALAVHDMEKARRRVAGVIRGFGIRCAEDATILDVGCGLGYYTKALSISGAVVTGLDFSEAAIAVARTTFPECRFSCGAWPEDVAAKPSFDLIWMVNFSLMNTFDVDFIERHLIGEAMARLKPRGILVIGWNTDFSGRTVDGYSHWPLDMLRTMGIRCGLSAPLVTAARTQAASWFLIRVASAIRRSIPIFMVKHKTGNDV
jgi:SAM-dependent methyltransferase